MQSVMMETTKLREPVAEFLRELSSTARRVVVVHDCLMTAVIQDVASIPNAESYIFHCVSAFTNFTNAWDAAGRPVLEDAEIPDGTPPIFTSFSLEFLNFIGYQIGCQKINCGTLYNTSRAIEGAHLDLVAKLENIQGIRYWAIGPVNPITISHNQNSKSRHKCLEWLDKQAPKSVLLVSFGTLTSLTDEQIGELAIGLEQSEQKFIWVLRDADKGDIFSGEVGIIQLPQGYEERIEAAGVGVVVRDWAPQVEILGHPSTGGFMSHCGWNSCLESITMGVPIAAWPMHSGQPRNTILITQVLKVGLAVKEEESQDVVASSTIEKVVRRLMASEEGDETRKRAAELGGILKRSLDEGGVSRMELDSFIAHISR
ncbi:hypothetical protein PVL29_002485 [Vitis rotundifolia]|uniref:Glycosyltransferase N-terminal domain-containing protein n=1 Tax=Vitis rotundifolia TaxID=103349 RepID=A0AA39AJA6_VITRO|nr:hypothetical protein PVL29_002485 [Vitis rotundifolia]